jgi:hypothetical protein
MRLEGRSDLVYRNYDLLRSKFATVNANIFAAAGFAARDYPQEYLVLSELREIFRQWGFGLLSDGKIKELMGEWYGYLAVTERGINYQYRHPLDIRRLTEEDAEARKNAPASGELRGA